jgi:hypothetical protein
VAGPRDAARRRARNGLRPARSAHAANSKVWPNCACVTCAHGRRARRQ